MSNNGREFTNDGTLITLVNTQMSLALPSSGPTYGGTLSRVMGTGIVPGATLVKCHFGEQATTIAAIESATSLSCRTPSAAIATSVTLKLSLDNVLHSTGLRYAYTSPQGIISVWPLAGPSRGGTVLTLTGGGFSQSVEYCRFSTSSLISPPVLARWLSETRVECVAPRSERTNDMASLEISINGQQFTSSGFDFAYLPDIELLDLEPPQGPMQGGSMLTIRGNHLHDSI